VGYKRELIEQWRHESGWVFLRAFVRDASDEDFIKAMDQANAIARPEAREGLS